MRGASAHFSRVSPVLVWVSVDVVGGCIISALWLDQALAEAFHRAGETPIIRLAGWVTHLGQASGYLAISSVAFFGFRYVGNRLRANQALFVFLGVAVSGAVVAALKVIVGRARPKLLFEEGIIGLSPFEIGHDVSSFPSGHATATAAAAVALAMIAPVHRDAFLIFGLIVASSRVIVQEHYLSDVIAGIAIGIGTVHLLRTAFQARTVAILTEEATWSGRSSR